MGHQFKKVSGAIGGAGSSATPDGYNAGPMIAAQGNYCGSVDGLQQMDLRKGNAAGSGPKAAPSGSGFNQGDAFAATKKSGTGGTVSADLRGGNSKVGTGYNQGSQK